MNNHRVVITGMGAVTPLGTGKDQLWESLIQGKSGIGPITSFDPWRFPVKIAGEVKGFDASQWLSRKEVKRNDRFVHFAVAAARMAVEDAKLLIHDENRSRIGVVIGSGIGGIMTIEQQHQTMLEHGPDRVSPFFIPMLIANMASGQVAIVFRVNGPNSCVVTACATGNHCIGEAYQIIKRGEADVMITGGSEAAISPLGIVGFCAMKALSTRNDDPQKASRPFDARRDGFVIAEGAGVVILETLDSAVKRKAPIYAEMIGYGMSSDAFHITAPDPEGEGASEAISIALSNSGILPEDVDYVNAHGTSTDLNDKLETVAIKRVFGDRAYKLAVSSTKSMTGHLLGATGAVEFIATALALKHGIIPPTMNYEYPDPECDLDYVPNKAREAPIKVGISNSFGFGGHNAVIVVKKFEE